MKPSMAWSSASSCSSSEYMITAFSGVRSSWLMLAKNWLLLRLAASAWSLADSASALADRCCSSLCRSASSMSRWRVTSVLVPNQRATSPRPLRIGTARLRNQRYCPSAPRSGKVSSHSLPSRTAAANRAATASTWSGWWTDRQPVPRISSRFVPVYSYHRLLYHWIDPDPEAIHASCGMLSAMSASFSAASSAACSSALRWVTSAKVTTAPSMWPSLTIGLAVYSTGKLVPSARKKNSSATRQPTPSL